MTIILNFITLAAIAAVFYFSKKQYDIYQKQYEELTDKIDCLEQEIKTLHEGTLRNL